MTTLEIKVDDKTLAAVKELAAFRQCSVEELLTLLLSQLSTPSGPIGLFRDEPSILDEVVQDAMNARATHPFRAGSE